jgi:DnaJ-class molecular chaperone
MSKAFATLGLPETATPDEVKAKWRGLCMIHHPDRGGNPVEFDEIRRAYKQAHAEASEPKPCLVCNGKGKVTHAHGFSSIELDCPTCAGSGTNA